MDNLDNHPIPQDITGFKFKLVGSMTIKQFGYVGFGAFFAWLFYSLPMYVFIKIPLALFFAGLGVSLAFLPVQGRPLDVMLRNFIKAVFRPTQYIYQKAALDLAPQDTKNISDFNKKRMSISEMSEQQLRDFLDALPKRTSNLDKREMVFFQNITQYQNTPDAQRMPNYVSEHAYANIKPQGASNLPQMPQLAKVDKQSSELKNQNQLVSEGLKKATEVLQKELQEAKQTEASESKVDSQAFLAAHQKVLELQKNLNDLAFQKQQLEEKLIQLQKQVDVQKQTVYSPSVAQSQPQPQQTKFVRSIPQNMTKSVGLPTAPEFPNVISGIVKDPRGNPLSNILVEVKDTQGNAVRAFKTNALGQYASATPLVNGDYTIEFDDPKGQNRFDTVGFKALGQVILPIEVISVDTREELRRSLFN